MDRLPQIIRSMPRECFKKQNMRAWSYLARDFALMVVVAALILATQSLFLKALLALVLGTVLTGLFVLGHDAGHRSFSDHKHTNDFVGHLCCSLTLWPFHVWRLSHDHHHKWTHHARNDIAWRPLTVDEFRQLSSTKKIGYYLSRTAFFFWASMLFQFFMIQDAAKGRFFAKEDHARLIKSLRITLAIAAAYALLSIKIGGLSGLIFLFVIPQLTFQFWLSFFTLFHHTSPDGHFMGDDVWDPAKAQLAHSIHIRFPKIVDWLTHDISWHVPHHVCVSVPHYHLRAAHRSLKRNYPDIVTEHKISFKYIWNVISQCHLVEQADTGLAKWVKISVKDHIVEPDQIRVPG